MYAVIETGGKQYRVEVGTELEVELLDGETGDEIALPRVLLVADGETAAIGRPLVANASVAAEIVRRDRGPKLINFKYGPKTRRRVKKGHRQELTVLRISDIVLDGKSAAGEKAEADAVRRAERARLDETARKQAAADAALAAKLAADKSATAKAKTAKADAAKPSAAKAKTAKADAGKADTGKAPKTKAAGTAKASTKSKSDATTAKPTSGRTAAPKAKTQGAEPTKTAAPKRRSTTKKDT
jgi:large subunit ribosomal protein L21